MAVDKLVDSTQLDADLTSVANAIRTKGGTSAQMAFPNGFVSAVNAIPTGGGGANYQFGYVRPADFPDLDSVANLPNGYYGILVRDEMDSVNYTVAGVNQVGLYTVENNNLDLIKTLPVGATTGTCVVTPEDTVMPVFIVQSTNASANNYNNPNNNNKTATRRYIESYIVGATINNNSANFPADANGFTTNYTRKLVFIGCTIQRPYAGCNGALMTDVAFENCVFSASNLSMFLSAPTIETVEFVNCSSNTAPTNIDRFLYNANNLRAIDLSMFDFSSVTAQSNAFVNCYQLTDFSGINISCSFNFSSCTSLSKQSLLNILNALETVSTATTLTLGSYLQAKLTSDEIAIATAKGWTVA